VHACTYMRADACARLGDEHAWVLCYQLGEKDVERQLRDNVQCTHAVRCTPGKATHSRPNWCTCCLRHDVCGMSSVMPWFTATRPTRHVCYPSQYYPACLRLLSTGHCGLLCRAWLAQACTWTAPGLSCFDWIDQMERSPEQEREQWLEVSAKAANLAPF
jgi:hypothetical protein